MYATRLGYSEDDIQRMLRGPLTVPDVTTMMDAARSAVADERAARVAPAMPPALNAAESGQVHSERVHTGAGAAPATVEGVDTTQTAEAHTAGLGVAVGEVRSENVKDLSRDEVEREDLRDEEAAPEDAAPSVRTAAVEAAEAEGAR